MSTDGLIDCAIGACMSEGGGCAGGVNVGYLTDVSVWKVSMSMGEDFILSATAGVRGGGRC